MELQIAAVTPRGLPDPAIAVAASRAGGIGILDLSGPVGPERGAALSRLCTHGPPAACGVKLDCLDEAATEIAGDLPPELGYVLVAPGERGLLVDLASRLRSHGRKLLLEAVDAADARLAAELGFDGVVAKGCESGGRVGEKTAFVLLQELASGEGLAVWAQGGISESTVAACRVAGASGVVIDAQLWLTRESSVPDECRQALERMDGTETVVIGEEPGESWRLFRRPDHAAVLELAEVADEAEWPRIVRRRSAVGDPSVVAWPVGQEGAFAPGYARRHRTVGGVIEALRKAAAENVGKAIRLQPLHEGSPLARSHGTRYPIAQGPMTRVSDRPEFAEAVAAAGALPFLALALMPGPEVRALLRETSDRLGDRSWGVGILGFVPSGLRAQQLEAIAEIRPPFALIAGGRPDQALALERQGIDTYLHVPSPGLLRLFAGGGARRFVFEGRECGGHVGPLTSFSLWSVMHEALLESVPPSELESVRVLYAGGIHDARSAAMTAAISAPLAERGVRVGALMGTAYLFTSEAVETGAIVDGFQREALHCDRTALLTTGPGHSTRCVRTPFAATFANERRRLSETGASADAIREQLERLNLGRLRLAAKGVERNRAYERDRSQQKLVAVAEKGQREDGMYMIGQVAALRKPVTKIAALHDEVSRGSTALLERFSSSAPPRRNTTPLDVAIVGIGCVLPGAGSLRQFWENVLEGADAIREVPAERWDWKRFYDPDPGASDKVTSRWGGFIDDVIFDPLRYGMPPASLGSIEPMQLLVLEVVRAALEDAGYATREFNRERTSVILGVGGGLADLGHRYALRAGLPTVLDGVPPELLDALPTWTEDTFAGILLNVAAGRVANRFDLGGVNYTVDAACASSLAAIHLAARELETGASDAAIVGGADTVQNPFGYLCFSRTQALSPRGRCRPFDQDADGIAISEGVGVMMLKRRADAERDGDRIYALLRAVEGSSDGRAKGLTAPRPEGQATALSRAYAKAGFSPSTVGLVEAHGTGTAAGDRAELETLTRVFSAAGARGGTCAIGSVKSMIGHTKCTAGVAGVAKAALALNRRILPPTINVEKPNAAATSPESPLYINSEAGPWVAAPDHPRRAGVSGFGFGGTNFHAVLEEYTGSYLDADVEAPSRTWPAELFVWRGHSAKEVRRAIEPFADALKQGFDGTLAELALTASQAATDGPLCLAAVATSQSDLAAKLGLAEEHLAGEPSRLAEPTGLFFSSEPLAIRGKVGLLFPGQGSQYPRMLCELAMHFGGVRERFEHADAVLAERFDQPLSAYVFPPPWFDDAAERRRAEALRDTRVAQPALGAAGLGIVGLLEELGICGDVAVGHSYGEYVALAWAGAISEDDLYRLSYERGRAIVDHARGGELGTMAAVNATPDLVRELVDRDVTLANLNSPSQVVISGSDAAVDRAVTRFKEEGIQARRLPVACAFHSPLVEPAKEALAKALSETEINPLERPVMANSTAASYPCEPSQAREVLGGHLTRPVRFQECLERMYDQGVRIFIEAGPRTILSGLARDTLTEREQLIVAVEGNGGGRRGLLLALAQVAAEGVDLDLTPLWRGRHLSRVDVGSAAAATGPPRSAWLVNGKRARPIDAEEPPDPAPLGLSVSGAHRSSETEPITVDDVQAELSTPDRDAGNGNGGGSRQIFDRFESLMGHFLEVQEDAVRNLRNAGPSTGNGGAYEPAEASAAVPPTTPALPRAVTALLEQERPHLRSSLRSGGAVLLIDHHDELGEAVALALGERGLRVVRCSEDLDADLPLDDPSAGIERLRDELGAPAAVIHLRALGSPADAWVEQGRVEALRFLGLLRPLAASPPKTVIAVTGRGGDFGLAGGHPRLADAALGGIVKTLSEEWRDATAKVVDVPADQSPGWLAAEIVGELEHDDGFREVGCQPGRRVALETAPAPFRARRKRAILEPGGVVLVTGGARGITARCALELAGRYQPRMVLTGRSPVPSHEEDSATRSLTSPEQLRAELVSREDWREQGPGAIEAEVRRLFQERAMRRTLEGLRAAGAEAQYRQLDARDAEATRALVKQLYADYGRIDAVIHGAGVIEDALISAKNLDSAERVLDTKATGALLLADALDLAQLRLLIFFASIAGRFGNPGQSDYAAANEVLGALARQLDPRCEGRVVAINWGPWADGGMVTPEVARRFADKGVEPIAAEAGAAAFIDELERGDGPEVILGAGPWSKPHRRPRASRSGASEAHTAEARISLHSDRDPCLHDHHLDGHAVLPAALALELLCQGAEDLHPEARVIGVERFQLRRGVLFTDTEQELSVTATDVRATNGDGSLRVAANLTDQGAAAPSYSAEVILGSAPAPFAAVPAALGPGNTGVSRDEAYRQYLFHGPSLRGIESIDVVNDEGVDATLTASAPGRLLMSPPRDRWIIDPLLCDSAFQLAIVWSRLHTRMTPLPTRLTRLRLRPWPGKGRVDCRLRVEAQANGHILVARIFFLVAGEPVLWLDGMQFSCTEDLNRLAGSPTVSVG